MMIYTYVSVQKCGRNFTSSSGVMRTPNWPQTYPNNVDCEWFITLPDVNKVVEITCNEEPYGIAGDHPQCDKDFLTIYDGHSRRDVLFGPYCQFIKPGTLKTSTRRAKVVFHAGPSHSSSRKGFRCIFRSVQPPTPAPPTPPPCGGVLNTASGSFQSPYWPETYPSNVDCQWMIELPDTSKLVEIKCEDERYGIAGTYPCLLYTSDAADE